MKNLNPAQLFAARPFARRFHSRTELLINTAASARWKDVRPTWELFQQSAGGDPLKTLCRICLCALCVLLWQSAPAATHYVDLNSTNATPPYTNWATAATNIQDAVDAAVAGEEVVVTNGTYASSGATNGFPKSRVAVDKPLSLRSVNGPAYTVIVGSWGIRCVYLTNGASLAGFTLQGAVLIDKGAGVFCESQSAVVSNCFLSGNGAKSGGGAYGGTLNNCTLGSNFTGNNNVNSGYGGGAAWCTLNNCTLTNNSSVGQYGHGGGAYGCALNNCTLRGNNGSGAEESELYNCILSGTLSGFGASYCTLNNCTVIANQDYGAYGSSLVNCIVYFNNSAGNGGYFGNYGGSTLSYCCTTPDPGSIGCITNDPLFVDGGDGRLQSNSPCINAGNNVYAPAGHDLDGNPRIVGGTVDIGAYEFQAPTSIISYAWLQYYGLPTDGSADFTDPDGDGMNNWQEWICDTNPTNALSVLRLLPPSTAASGVNVSWQSVATRNYVLERSTNLTAQPAFTPLATNIPGQIGTTTFTDTNAIGSGPWFYRVAVSP